uniref:ZAD domain-containing protein n=1 Tax=Anopheles minimus TaxID=112268 RepID=A0A182VTQ6_9DIPT
MDSDSLLSMNLALNVARKCRICGMDILDLTCAFPIFGNDRLDQKIERYLQLNIQIDDLLPKCICGSCYLKLESIDQFSLMANRTEEAFRSWLSRLRGLNCPAEAAKNVNVMLPLYRPDPDIVDTRKGTILCAPKIVQNIPAPAMTLPNPPASSSPPDKGIISYSDLKLGLLIKDQELLKLILKALKWAENDRRASFEVLIQRLKNSSFREILSNRNLLNDSDLTQLLKSYIGQGVMNSFASASAGTVPLNNNVPPTVPLQPNALDQFNQTNEYFAETNKPKSVHHTGLNVAMPPTGSGAINVNEYRMDEASVTQMEVGVDPDLYLPYEDEDSSNATKFEARLDDRQENTVTIKLVTTNVAGDMIENKRMIPAILNVRGNKRFQCSACPECFETNGELQQHIVRRHLPRTNRTVMTDQGKPAIKIRVRKNKPVPMSISPNVIPKVSSVLAKPSPVVPVESIESTSPSPIKIVPLKIPASTTITVVPANAPVNPIKPVNDHKLEISTTTEKKPPLQSPPKEQLLVRKSKRKSSIKLDVSSLLMEKQKKRKVPKEEQPTTSQSKSSRKAHVSFCTLCRKKLTPRESMRDHMQQEHSRFECEKCDRAFKSALNLNRHQQYHTNVAGTITTPNVAKSATQKTPKVNQQPEEQTYKCTYCEKAFKRNHHLKEQLLVRKSKRKSSIKLDVSSLLMEKQKKRKVPKEEQPTTSQSKSSRKAHVSFCTLCRKKLTPRESMRDHMQQEHSRFECEKCDRAFKSALNLNRHQQYHTNVAGTITTPNVAKSASQKTPKVNQQPEEQTYKCHYCEKAFKRNHHLKLHLKHHTKDAPGRGSEEKPATGNGLRRRAKDNHSAISSVLHVSETSTRTRKAEASKLRRVHRNTNNN